MTSSTNDPVLVTGAAGFIGFHTAQRLLANGRRVIGADSFNTYYDVKLKEARWQQLEAMPGFIGARTDLADRDALFQLCDRHEPASFIHLAAQPGVRYGIDNPGAYVDANLIAFMNVLEAARAHEIDHFVYASTSSVYGANRALPYAEHQPANHPLSLYAATKRANELLAHSYAHLFKIPCTGLRFFTVYGPWGRPDMAPQKFAARIFAGDQIEVYNGGNLKRDFTYVDDVVEGIVRVLDHIPVADESWDAAQPTPDGSGVAPYRIFNIGRGAPIDLMDFIATLEKLTGRKANMVMTGMQPGDVEGTWCDVSALERAVGYRPRVSLDNGLARMLNWFRKFYGV